MEIFTRNFVSFPSWTSITIFLRSSRRRTIHSVENENFTLTWKNISWKHHAVYFVTKCTDFTEFLRKKTGMRKFLNFPHCAMIAGTFQNLFHEIKILSICYLAIYLRSLYYITLRKKFKNQIFLGFAWFHKSNRRPMSARYVGISWN